MSVLNTSNSKKDIETLHLEKEKVQHVGYAGDASSLPAPDSLAVDFKHDLHRGLKSRQIAMVLTSPSYRALTGK